MLKKILMIIVLTIIATPLFSQMDPDYLKAIQFFSQKYYEQSIEYLLKYIQNNTNDQKAVELLESIYSMEKTFKIEFLKGKNSFNQRLYKKALKELESAKQVGNHNELDYLIEESRKKIAELENTFLQSSIAESSRNVLVQWESELFNQSRVFLVAGEDWALFRGIVLSNRNRIPQPIIEELVKNSFKKFRAKGNYISITTEYEHNMFLIIVYPYTEDSIKAQPIVTVVIKNVSEIRRIIEPETDGETNETVSPAVTNEPDDGKIKVKPVLLTNVPTHKETKTEKTIKVVSLIQTNYIEKPLDPDKIIITREELAKISELIFRVKEIALLFKPDVVQTVNFTSIAVNALLILLLLILLIVFLARRRKKSN